MSDKAQILFRLFWVKFDDEARGRWPITRAFAAVLSALDDAGLRDEFELHGVNDHPNRRQSFVPSRLPTFL